jgi:hypothetical protein
MTLPEDVGQYLGDLVERLKSTLHDQLLAVYLLGGIALGDYRPGSSDLDVYAVVRRVLKEHEKRSVAASCGNQRLPCPAPKLELVLVCASVARKPGPCPRWELNLNTGPAIREHLGLDASAEPSHWFVLDLALARQQGVTLFGPPPDLVIGPSENEHVITAQQEVVEWYRRHDMYAEAVLAAFRAWYWMDTGRFAAKGEAVRWATGMGG